MGNSPDDSRIQRIAPPRVNATNVSGTNPSSAPDGSRMVDDLLEDIGIGNSGGGSA